MEILWLSGEFTDEASCRRHASACRGETTLFDPTRAVASPESPDRRGLSGATAVLSRLTRATAIPCARRLAVTPDRLPQSTSIL